MEINTIMKNGDMFQQKWKTYCNVNEEEIDNLMALMSCNMFKKQAIGYIRGYVLKMITRFIKYSVCYNACLAKNNTSKVDVLHLFQLKQRGPLLMPSKCVSEICITMENAIRNVCMKTNVVDDDNEVEFQQTHKILRIVPAFDYLLHWKEELHQTLCQKNRLQKTSDPCWWF